MNVRAKGAGGERELAEWLFKKELTQTLCKRNLEQVRAGGIDLIPDNHPFAYEVKRVEKITGGTWDGWWIKAMRDCKFLNREPVVAFRTSRSEWMFLISVDKLLGMPGNYAILKGLTFVKFAQKRIIGYGT
jgi:hypothetical protein